MESSRLTIPETEFQIAITEKQNLHFSFAFNSIVFCISTCVLAFIMPPGKLCKASEKNRKFRRITAKKISHFWNRLDSEFKCTIYHSIYVSTVQLIVHSCIYNSSTHTDNDTSPPSRQLMPPLLNETLLWAHYQQGRQGSMQRQHAKAACKLRPGNEINLLCNSQATEFNITIWNVPHLKQWCQILTQSKVAWSRLSSWVQQLCRITNSVVPIELYHPNYLNSQK